MIVATCPRCAWTGSPTLLRHATVVAHPLPGLLQDDRPRCQQIATVRCPQCRAVWRHITTGAPVGEEPRA